MNVTILIFDAAQSYVGLWRPEAAQPWVTHTVADRSKAGNQILCALDTLCRSEGLSLTEVTHIGVMQGPASYTQLRLYIATANALAWARSLPLFKYSPDTILPDMLPSLLASAHVNLPVEPTYPSSIG